MWVEAPNGSVLEVTDAAVLDIDGTLVDTNYHHALELFDGRRLADAWTTSEDVDRTKPEPDLISVAVERVGGTDAVVIGDSVWDFVAAGKAGHVGYAIRSGGFSDAELRDADARDVFDSVVELREALDRVLA